MYSHSFFIVGLIIAKSERKIHKPRQHGTSSGVITFTVRDTKEHFINCVVWGAEHFIENCDRAFKIGDVCAIYQASVFQKNGNSTFSPRTTSPFELTVNEGKAYIHRATEHFNTLTQWQHQAVKSTSLALMLSDLNATPDGNASEVDLIVFGECETKILIGFSMRLKLKNYLL